MEPSMDMSYVSMVDKNALDMGEVGYELITAAAYFSIPALILYAKYRVPPDCSPVSNIFALMASFMVGCSFSHLLQPFVNIHPILWGLSNVLRLATLVLAVLTSATIYHHVPFFASMPSPCKLRKLNEELQTHRDNLHNEVTLRTQELAQEKAKWMMITEQSPHILWLKDTAGKITFFNKTWYDYTGIKPGKQDLTACTSVVHPVDLETVRARWGSGGHLEHSNDYKIRIKSKDNVYRWHLVRSVPIRNVQTNEVTQYVGISTDIHDTETVKELSIADATRKSRFLATVSHEMRTPLTGIIGMSTLLGDTQLRPDQVDLLNNVKESADRLLVLVNNILDLFKIHNDKLLLDTHTFALEDCVQGALSTIAQEAKRKGLTIHDKIDRTTLPVIIQGDKVRLEQVLQHLLANALKFTHTGGHIYISAQQDPDNRGLLKFSIRDTGIGIQKEDMAKLFDTFWQNDTSATRKFAGAGLGLAICKGLVELMHGSIWCESTPGKGSTFHFTFQAADMTHMESDAFDMKAPHVSAPLLYTHDYISSSGLVYEHDLTSNNSSNNNSNNSANNNDSNSNAISNNDMNNITNDNSINNSSIKNNKKNINNDNNSINNSSSNNSSNNNINNTMELIGNWESTSKDFGVSIIKPKVLVVDDTEMNQKVLKRLLASMDHMLVDVVSDGAQAVQAVQSGDYDIVFMDMEMPVMDGVTATTHIRAMNISKQPHIVAVTANAFQEDVQKCLHAGMCAHMAKPLKREHLRKHMDSTQSILAGNEKCRCHDHHHSHSHALSHAHRGHLIAVRE